MELINSLELTGEPAKLAVEGSYAYVGGVDPLLQIVDISNPFDPLVVGAFDDNAFMLWNLCVKNGIVFMATGWDGLFIVDSSNPYSPVLLDNYVISDHFHDVIVGNNIAYILACHHLYIVDISVLSNPVAMGDTNMYMYMLDGWNFYIDGDYAYIPDTADGGLTILNISDPFRPIITARYEEFEYGYDISIVQEYAYVTGNDSLRILDVSDPSNPFMANSFGHTYSGNKLFCKDDYAFMAKGQYHGGIRVLDISEPNDPQLVFFYDEYNYQDVFACNGLIYALREPNRLDIFQFSAWTGIDDRENIPIKIRYLENFPNPFNSATTINFSQSEPGAVNLYIYNIQGQIIAELSNGYYEAGEHTISWDASDYPSGVYFARLEAGGLSRTAKMVLLK